MRILNRPMFKYGGPIREGVMHGMKNGGLSKQFNTGLVGDERYPKTGGREHHVAFLAPMLWAGARMAARPFGRWAMKNIPKMFAGPGKPTWNIGKGFSSTPGYTKNVAQNVFTPTKLGSWFGRDPLAKSVMTGSSMLGRGLKYGGQKIGQVAKYSTTTPSGLLFMGLPVTIAGGKWLLSDGTELDDNQKKQVKQVKQEGVPGGGDPGMTYTDPDKAKKLAKEKQNERMKSYLDMMGYDRSKKTAMSDALIDASALVQDATTEAGSIKHADWGKLINKAIQTTSKRYDKPEQIREAVGLMATKAAIEKDMTAEEDALKKIAAELNIKIGKKTLAGASFEDIVSDRMIKSDMLKGDELASLFRIKKGIDAKVISTAKMGADQDALTYVKKIMADKKKEGTPYPEGYYVISDRIVVVDGQGNVKKEL